MSDKGEKHKRKVSRGRAQRALARARAGPRRRGRVSGRLCGVDATSIALCREGGDEEKVVKKSMLLLKLGSLMSKSLSMSLSKRSKRLMLSRIASVSARKKMGKRSQRGVYWATIVSSVLTICERTRARHIYGATKQGVGHAPSECQGYSDPPRVNVRVM